MRTRKRSIAGLMWLVFLFAIWLTLVRGEPEGRWLARCFFLLMAAFLAAMWVWFVVVPQNSLKLARGSVDRQRRLLEWVVKTPGIPRLKIHARYLLAVNYQCLQSLRRRGVPVPVDPEGQSRKP